MTDHLIHSGSFEDYYDNEIIVSFYKKDDGDSDAEDALGNDLKFSGDLPVVINYNGSTDDIYAPVKTSSCDVNIISEHILDDLYTPNKDDIRMTVVKKTPHKTRVIKYIDTGGVVSAETIYDINQSYFIHTANQFFTDINGDFRFNGKINKEGESEFGVTLQYNPVTERWMNNNPWVLDSEDQYFWVGTESYRIIYNSGNDDYSVAHWESDNSWSSEIPYRYYDTVTHEDNVCDFGAENIVHYTSGDVELLYGNLRLTWNEGGMWWDTMTPYTDSDGGTYTSLDGSTFMRVYDGQGNIVDGAIVTGYAGDETWVVKLDRVNNTFTRLFEVTVEDDEPGRVFTDDDGYAYYVRKTGKIYSYSWNLDEWVEWISFVGDLQSGTFGLSYIIPGTSKKVMFKYMNTDDEYEVFMLSGFEHPVCYEDWVVVPGQYDYIDLFEGYKIPNTFSQDVTQNLDEISMTCIDPVALLKSVKIDKIMSRPAVKTYGELIGKALAYVKLTSNKLWVEHNVTYGSAVHTSTNNLMNMMCQVSNFWDEGDEPSTLYEMIEELLRPFCLTLQYINGKYCIYNQTRTSGTSVFDLYYIGDDGTLSAGGMDNVEGVLFDFANKDWKSNNTETAVIEIGSTYGKVSAIASTSIPKYSSMVTDRVNYEETDKYDIGQLNVQRNKTKGYMLSQTTVPQSIIKNEADYWFYLWNGVYTDADFELVSYLQLVNGWLNINKAYEYLNGTAGNPTDYGSILNFYGGANNPTATGREATDKPVEVKSRITAYAPDNGVPPEFLELTELAWSFDSNYRDVDGQLVFDPQLTKSDTSKAEFGTDISSNTERVVYHQEYENVILNGLNSQSLDINIKQSYSRTGIDVPVDILSNNTAANNYFILLNPLDGDEYYRPIIKTADVNYFPELWNWDNVKVDDMYFHRYATNQDNRITEVWDRRRIDVYIELNNGNGILHFNGKDWMEEEFLVPSHSFYLLKMMNYSDLYHTEYSYNVIETADFNPLDPNARGRYSLTEDTWGYQVDANGGVVEGSENYNRTCPPYKSESNIWSQWIESCGEGKLSIVLPTLEGTSGNVIVDVCCSSLLGITGGALAYSSHIVPVYYKYEGTGQITPEGGEPYDVTLSENNIGSLYGTIGTCPDGGASISFLPPNVSHIKAEHLDLNISMDVPESNLGQMFSQSDIKYVIDKKNDYDEEYKMPEFRENTYNPLVNDSFSYLIFDSQRADPDMFVINGLAVRPESYTVQAYMNWLSTIRKSYGKTLVPLKDGKTFNNFKTFITSPEVGSNKLMVVADTWDVKSGRHRIKSVEANGLDVTSVSSYSVTELPRRARAERWNLPTAKK